MSNLFNRRAAEFADEPRLGALNVAVVIILLTASAVAQEVAGRFRSSAETSVERRAGSSSATSLTEREFVIGSEDVLWISVWKEPELSEQVVVRSDGKISLPLVGEMKAAGQTTQELQAQLTDKLREYLSSPMVTIVVREAKSRSFNVLGQVQKPGTYSLQKTTTVLDSLALAGGFREWAKIKSIYVLRRGTDGSIERLLFDYKKAIRGTGGDFELQPRDVIVVP